MLDIKLEAKDRSVFGRDTAVLREEGNVPAVVYGAGIEPKSITLDRNQFVKMYKQSGASSIVELVVEGASPIHVLIQDIQLHPIKDSVIHVDFLSVDMTKEIEATVSLEFVGEAPAVKALGGTLMTSRDTVDITCLPTKLVRSLMVDLSKLVTFDDVIRVGDLEVGEGVTIREEDNLMIVGVSAPRTEAEMEALDEVAAQETDDAAEGEEKKDGEEGAAEGEEKKEEK